MSQPVGSVWCRYTSIVREVKVLVAKNASLVLPLQLCTTTFWSALMLGCGLSLVLLLIRSTDRPSSPSARRLVLVPVLSYDIVVVVFFFFFCLSVDRYVQVWIDFGLSLSSQHQ